MNFLYFACVDCTIYIDAGYRWAYWELEHTGVVSRQAPVKVDAVFAAKSFWNPPKDGNSQWLYEGVFPPLREFLEAHNTHRIVFGENVDFAPDNDDYYLTWLQVGYSPKPTPRYLAEVLNFRTWDDANAYLQTLEIPPAWWQLTWDGPPSSRERGKRVFEMTVAQSNGS